MIRIFSTPKSTVDDVVTVTTPVEPTLLLVDLKIWEAETIAEYVGDLEKQVFRTINNNLYKLNSNLPFTTSDFAAELTAGNWVLCVKGTTIDFTQTYVNLIDSKLSAAAIKSKEIIASTAVFSWHKKPSNLTDTLAVDEIITDGRISDTIHIYSAIYTNALADDDIDNFGTLANRFKDGNYKNVKYYEF